MKKNPWLPVIIVSFAILILTSIPKVPTPVKKIHSLDKVAHFLIYFLWGYTLTIVWRVKANHTKSFISSIIIFIILFPAFDELHQYLIPSRNPSFLDWLCDITGAIAGFCAFAKWKTTRGILLSLYSFIVNLSLKQLNN
ncbi:MAG: hypothetical protein E3J87_09460 [Candidatus Cloacimonadota bacterium]|nr:MAG: hypothetical protein E3J87_09460 [Candidatus Cloacimonadota bacterium]